LTTYVQVPPAIAFPPSQSLPVAGLEGSYRKSPAQRGGRAEPATARLGQWSINDTAHKSPSEIAIESFRKCPSNIKQKYGKLLMNFCDYMQMCDKSGFSAHGIAVGSPCRRYPDFSLTRGTGKNDFGRRTISGPLLNRWHPQRRINWIAKMYKVGQWYEANRIDGCTMISLTGYQEKDGYSWYDTLDNINESRVKLLKILRKYLGKVSYFWVVEPHTENNTGYPHIHLAIFRDIDNKIRDQSDRICWIKAKGRENESIWEIEYGEGMEDKLRRLYSDEWKTGSHTYGLDFRQMKGENQIEDLKNYLMKYISKGYIGEQAWSPGELIFNAHLYGATHGNRPPKGGEQPDFKGKYNKKYRIINMSRDLSAILKPEQEDEEDIIWLHTDETEPTEIKNDDGEIITEERVRVLYDRQLIPDWLSAKGFDWGRPTQRYTGYDAITKYNSAIPRRERNKETAW
jgi:hypothetical protein